MFAVNAPGTASQAQIGPDLPEVSTEAIGFQAIAGETKLRILPAPWPSGALPKPTSSLLSIASRQELLAAAGPDTLIIGSTSAVREAFVKDGPSENKVKQFQPQLSLPVPRLSQVAFSADETTLTISAAEGGGLQVYEVSALKQGIQDPAFQLPTNGVAVRALLPNPAPESGHLLALVLEQGQLMIANLKERKFENGLNGMILRDGVSSISWSNKGKQLTAGLGNGMAVQLTPSGEVKAEIPRYPQLDGDQHVSSVTWLDNDHWLFIYTPSQFNQEGAPDSTYCYVSREKGTKNFAFQKFGQDPCVPFGMNRSPPFHHVCRLREYPPSLADALLLASTAAGDIGMIACSQTPLSADIAAANTANQYTTIAIANDTRKAQLPVDESMIDTSAIGAAIDLSSKDKVPKPIPAEEIDTSAHPLPGFAVLNNEGLLSYWWFVYSDSIRQGKPYPGLVAASEGNSTNRMLQQAQTPPSSIGFGAFSKPQNAFGATSSISPSPFGKPGTPTFGSSTMPSTFGSSGGLGQNKSPWATTSTSSAQSTNSPFGQATFGSSTPLASGGGFASASGSVGGFGAVGGLGQNKSPWATTVSNPQTDSKPNAFSNTNTSSPFSAFSQNSQQKAASPFGGLSGTTSGFASLGQTSNSIFGTAPTSTAPSMPNQPSFGSTVTIGSNLTNGSSGGPSSFGEPKSAWGTPSLSQRPSGITESKEADMGDAMDDTDTKPEKSENAETADRGFGLFSKPSTSSTGFQFQSSFKPDPMPKQDATDKSDNKSMFGGNFSSALSEAQKPAESDKKEPEAEDPPKKDVKPLFGEIPSSATKSLFNQPASAPKEEKKETLDKSDKKTEKETPTEVIDDAPLPPDPSTYKPPAELEPAIDDAPLPPDPSTYKPDTEAEPIIDDAPLPPDPSTYKTPAEADPAPLPPSPKLQKQEVDDDEPPLPPSPKPQENQPLPDDLPPSPVGSSPVDLGKNSPEAELPLPQPETPANVSKSQGKPAPSWAFPSGTPKSPELDQPSQPISPLPSFTPAPSLFGNSQPSTTPFGAGKPVFVPPSTSGRTPRSPSPTSRGRLFGANRSVTSPSPTRRNFSTTPMAPPPTKSILPTATPDDSPQAPRHSLYGVSGRLQATSEMKKPSQDSRAGDSPTVRRKPPIPEPRQIKEEFDPLDDYEAQDAHIVAELSAPIEPTKILAPFLAHQDYVGHVAGTGVPAQIEKIYRDINSMVDTLGLNARSLKSWIAGHEQFKDGGRTRDDLNLDEAGHEEWSLIEIADLGVVEKEISEILDAERIEDVREKVAELIDLRREVTKLRQRNVALQQTIYTYQNPDQEQSSTSSVPSTPQARRLARAPTASPSPRRVHNGLTPEQSGALLSLRKQYTTITTQLSDVEDALTLLRAKLASNSTGVGIQASFTSSTSSIRSHAETASTPVAGRLPTVEAVISTITKMTRMVEQKSGDLDVLEAQMKRLRFRAKTESQGLDEVLGAMSLSRSREGTPTRAATGIRARRAARERRTQNGTGMYELTYSDDEDGTLAKDSLAREEDDEMAAEYLLRLKHRDRVMELLKKSVAERGPKVVDVVRSR